MPRLFNGNRIPLAIGVVCAVVYDRSDCVGAVPISAFGYGDSKCTNWFRCVYSNVDNREATLVQLQAVIGTPDECTDFHARYAYAVAAMATGPPDGCADTALIESVKTTQCKPSIISPACHTRYKLVPLATTGAFMGVIGISAFWSMIEIVLLKQKIQRHKSD